MKTINYELINRKWKVIVLLVAFSLVFIALNYRTLRNRYYNYFYPRDILLISGDSVWNLSKFNVPELLSDKSPEAALKLANYYKWVKGDDALAEKWIKEYERRQLEDK